MNRSLRIGAIAVVAAVAGFAAGCTPTKAPDGTVGSVPTTPPATTTPAAPGSTPTEAPVLADGRSPVLITSVDVSKKTITFDLIELYLGTDAFKEWQKDNPGSTEHPPLNGHYTRNNNPKLRTLPVAATVVVKVLNQYGDPNHPDTIALDKLTSYASPRHTFWITVKDGVVLTIEEQFFP